ncbi:MAG TPA: hypothetical protein VE954_43170 [Oligoflexus sp.]|uniref:Acb2/Tad1 domain-containing protein n=1 Tax=Oligoflexus sp. TaxID=1971216 RepID=UPI002D26AE75|nr:hypothetical protein [Oligoflexus sp.]HYX39946.1 hypothetical protein [Oligoflexus sp.]
MSRFDFIAWDGLSEHASRQIKSYAKMLEACIDHHLEPSRERSLAMTALEECFMWVGKGIRHDQLERQKKGDDGTLPLPEAEPISIHLPKGWEAVGLPRRIGAIMAVEVIEKR